MLIIEQLVPMPDPGPELRAYHEAGHALVAVCFGDKVTAITIRNLSASVGGMARVESGQLHPTPVHLTLMGGAAAEVAYLGHDPEFVLRTSAYGDYVAALELGLADDPLLVIQSLVGWFSRATVARAAHALAAQLMERITLDGPAAEDIIWDNLGMDDDHELTYIATGWMDGVPV